LIVPSLQEALRAAQLVSTARADAEEQKRRERLANEEKQREVRARLRGSHDEEQQQRQERFLRGAGRETTQAGSRVGTKAYFDRFKK
jgi:hypothetical protein